MSALSAQDEHLVRVYLCGYFHYWDRLPEAARAFLAAGGPPAALRAAVRHLVVLAGYGPCLAAMLALRKARLLGDPAGAPVKAGGPPGDAFELVYADVADAVRAKVHDADPGLGEWIRAHLYGDVYSSPGLPLRAKQLLMCAGLADAGMHEQLFGHALAALRFGARAPELEAAVALAFEMAPPRADAASRDAVRAEAEATLGLAAAKFERDRVKVGCPEVHIPDPASVREPPLPPLVNAGARGAAAAAAAAAAEPVGCIGAGEGPRAAEPAAPAGVTFAWEELDDRLDPATHGWRD